MRELLKEKLYLEAIKKTYLNAEKDLLVFYYKRLDSTMNQALKIANELTKKQTAIVVAESQSLGRGRNGHVWESAANDNLYMTLVKKVSRLPNNITAFSLVVGLVLVEVLEELFVLDGESLRLKWPNDILYLDGRKLSGILLETKKIGEDVLILIGIGINLKHAPISRAVALNEISTIQVSSEDLVGKIVTVFEQYWQLFLKNGFTQYKDLWLAKSLHIGKKIKVSGVDKVIEGIMFGVAEDGALLIENEVGIQKIFSGDIAVSQQSEKG